MWRRRTAGVRFACNACLGNVDEAAQATVAKSGFVWVAPAQARRESPSAFGGKSRRAFLCLRENL